MFSAYRFVAGAVCIAFGVVLPIVFHMLGVMGTVFLPMHIPVMIAGLFIGAEAGVITGILAPVLSSFMTGMPPLMPVLPLMIAELSVYGMVSGYLHRHMLFPLITSLIGAMLAGRFVAAGTAYLMVTMLNIKLHPLMYLSSAVITGLPGVMIQLIFVPLIVKRLQVAFGIKKNWAQKTLKECKDDRSDGRVF